MTRHAAYFLDDPDLLGRPLDDAILLALLRSGYQTDVYVTGEPTSADPEYLSARDVRVKQVSYNANWLRSNILSNDWKRYSVVLAASNLPVAAAYPIARRAGAKFVFVCDEIYTDRVSPAVGRAEKLAKFGMRNADATIITDLCREALHREYCGLFAKSHRFVEVPSSFVETPVELERKASLRRYFGVPENLFLVSYSGGFHDAGGADDFLSILECTFSKPVGLLIQSAGNHEKILEASLRLAGKSWPLFSFLQRTTFTQALRITAMADLGFVAYKQRAPQFQNMGLSSNKFCCHLMLGQPVVAYSQPSFTEIERQGAARLYSDPSEIQSLIDDITLNYPRYSSSARSFWKNVVNPSSRIEQLLSVFNSIG